MDLELTSIGIRVRSVGLLAAAALLSAACGSYNGDEQNGAVPPAPPPTGGSSGPSEQQLIAAFETTVWPILNPAPNPSPRNSTQRCAECHYAGGSAAPAIADDDVTRAFRAVWDNGKVNLTTPSNSRIVRRLSPDQHHCWSNDCAADSVVMETAVQQWAALVNWGGGSGGSGGSGGTQVSGLVSASATLADGFEDQGQERDQKDAIAFWDFKEGTGTVAHDTSGLAPAIDLTLNGATWLSSYGLDFQVGSANAPSTTARKLYDRIADTQTGSQQYTIEAWVTPANTTQGDPNPARIVSYDGNSQLRQRLYSYQLSQASVAPNNAAFETLAADQDLQARLQHVVMTYDRYRGRRFYVDARYTDDMDRVPPQALWNWSPNARLAIGNSSNNDRQWMGQIRMLAIYDRVVPLTQIQQNFAAGVGKRLLLRFDTSQWAGAGSYIEFLVMELDNYSYLFCQPTLVSTTMNQTVSGMRILVNGTASVTGQAFTNVNRVVSLPREVLSPLCSIIPKDQGPASDVFTIDFENLAGYTDPEPPTPVPPLPPRQFGAALPTLGLRDFARVNAAMAAVTGVDPLTPSVDSTYVSLTQQMPPSYDLRTFASAQQVAITKLSLEYCEALVETPSLRTAFFGAGFDFNAAPATAFASQASRDSISQSITDHILGANLSDQPSMAETQPILDQLITDLTATCSTTPCDATRTRTVVKAMCTAAIASAAASIH